MSPKRKNKIWSRAGNAKVTREELIALRVRMLQGDYKNRQFALYMGVNESFFSHLLSGSRTIDKHHYSKFVRALDQFDKWVKQGKSIEEEVVEKGRRYKSEPK